MGTASTPAAVTVEVHAGVAGALLEPLAQSEQLVISFENLSSFVDVSYKKPSLQDRLRKVVQLTSSTAPSNTRRQILHNISGQVVPGELLALMGPSGSGKTSVLSVISGRTPKFMTVEGRVLVNGQAFTKANKKRMGFVLQDDLLYESLTVSETLRYAGELKLPRAMSREEKMRRVEDVIHVLGLDKCKDTIIGGFLRRGVSGGERKRVSVGHELIINPSVLMLDEPTSGLDSTTAMHLVTTLSQLASRGRAVITTIHQPSSRLYQQLDKLMLLGEGHILYYGIASEVVTWFSHLGFILPYGVNTADFILDLAVGEVVKGPVQGSKAVECMYLTYETYAETHESGFLHADELPTLEHVRAAVEDTVDQAVTRSSTMNRNKGMDRKQSTLKRSGTSFMVRDYMKHTFGMDRPGAAYITQIRVLLSRCLQVRRFESLSFQKFLQLGLVAAITGLLWYQSGASNTLESAQDVTGLLFFELLFPCFSTMFSALFTFPSDYRMLLKERASGMYQVSAFYFARTLSDLPMDCTYPTLFIILVYFLGGLRLTAAAFFANWGVIMLTLLVAQSLGLMIGAIFMNPKSAQTASTVLMLTFMLIGGYYVRNVPAWIAWVKYLSFIYWSYNMLLRTEFSDRTIVDCGGVEVSNTSGCTPVDVSSALALPVDVNGSQAVDAIVLVAMLIALRVLVYIVLRVKTSST